MATALTIDADTIVSRSDRVAFHVLTEGEGGVLLHLDTGAYHGVNDFGVVVWELLDRPRRFAELVAHLDAELEDAPPMLGEDIREFLTDLSARDLVALTSREISS
jgi:hypothetical protein